jgi:hypothetical protein
VHSSVGASWWERDAPFEFVLRLAGFTGRTGQANRALTEPERSPSAVTVWLQKRGNEKESPSNRLQKLHLTERGNCIQNAVWLIFTEDEFSMA